MQIALQKRAIMAGHIARFRQEVRQDSGTAWIVQRRPRDADADITSTWTTGWFETRMRKDEQLEY